VCACVCVLAPIDEGCVSIDEDDSVELPSNAYVTSFGECAGSEVMHGAGCYMECQAGYKRKDEAVCEDGSWQLPEEPCVAE
jgi:hypothetical protein